MATKTNFTSNGKDYYRITYDIEIDANGKRIRKQFVGKSKKDAENKKLDYINKTSMGLKESDIDYKLKEIHINKTVATTTIFDNDNKRSKQTIVQEPKSKNSKRIIPLPESLIEIIKEAIKIKKSEKLKAGDSYCTDNLAYIFLSQEGNLINASNLNKSWENFLKHMNIPHKKFHLLRHTYATKQFENNIPLKTVSMLLGHSDISITANIYTHVLNREKEKSIDVLGDIKTMV